MSRYVIGSLTARVTTLCLLSLVLAGCQKGEIPAVARAQDDDFTWMRKALERNPQLEVLASDGQSGIFTVRYKATGEVQALKLNELAAAGLAVVDSWTDPADDYLLTLARPTP